MLLEPVKFSPDSIFVFLTCSKKRGNALAQQQIIL